MKKYISVSCNCIDTALFSSPNVAGSTIRNCVTPNPVMMYIIVKVSNA